MQFLPHIAFQVSQPDKVVRALLQVFGGEVVSQSAEESCVALNGVTIYLEHTTEAVSTVWLSVTCSDVETVVAELSGHGYSAKKVDEPENSVMIDSHHGIGFLVTETG